MDNSIRLLALTFTAILSISISHRVHGEAILLNPLPDGGYSIVGLGDLGGANAGFNSTQDRATGINAAGHVVGYSKDSTGNNLAFFWSPESGMSPIGTHGNDLRSIADGINDSSTVTGTSNVWVAPGETRRGFTWSTNVGMSVFDGPQIVFANDINNDNVVVGSLQESFGAPWRAFKWNANDGIQLLPLIGGSESRGYGINDRGQVVGLAQSPSNEFHTVVWEPDGSFTDLGPESAALGPFDRVAINDFGHVVGTNEDRSQPFLWTHDEGLNWLDWPGSVAISAINNRGQVIGRADGNPSIWSEANGLQQLNSLLVDDAAYVIESVFDINDSGQIVGSGMAVPEPTNIWLCGIIFVCSFFRRRLYYKNAVAAGTDSLQIPQEFYG